MAPKVTKYLGYFCNKICCKELSKTRFNYLQYSWSKASAATNLTGDEYYNIL